MLTIFLAGVLPVYAINLPSPAPTLDVVNAYESTIEAGDQLYIYKFTIPYTSYPAETASQSFLARLFDVDGVTELGASTLYNNPYFHSGYGQGIISLYFSAADVATKSMVWGAAYTASLDGNPILSWNGNIPHITNTITWDTGGSTSVAVRVISLALQFQSIWGLVVTLTDSGTLTSYGDNYFTGTIPNLRNIAPTIFTGYITTADFHERTYSLTYALTLRNQWIRTWLDLTALGTDWGVDAIWIYMWLWLIVLGGVDYGIVLLAQSTKPLLYATLLMLTFGGLTGFLPWLAAIGAGAAIILLITEKLFWSKSGA